MTLTLTGAIDATQNNVQLSGNLDAQPGDLFRLDDELVEFGSYLAVDRQHAVSRSLCSFGRGVDGTTAASHTAGTELLGAVEAVESGTTSVIPAPFPSGGGGGVTNPLSAALETAGYRIKGADNGAITGAFVQVGDNNGAGVGGALFFSAGDSDVGTTGAPTTIYAGSEGSYTFDPAALTLIGASALGHGKARLHTAGGDGTTAQFLGSDGSGDVVWRDPAAFVDPTTATPEDICNALIAAGLMAPS